MRFFGPDRLYLNDFWLIPGIVALSMRNWVKEAFYKIIKSAIRQVTFLISELQWLIQNRFEAYKIQS